MLQKNELTVTFPVEFSVETVRLLLMKLNLDFIDRKQAQVRFSYPDVLDPMTVNRMVNETYGAFASC